MIRDPEIAVRCLQERGDRDVYISSDGDWFITYRGGQVHHEVVGYLKRKGILIHKWPDRKDLECYKLSEDFK